MGTEQDYKFPVVLGGVYRPLGGDSWFKLVAIDKRQSRYEKRTIWTLKLLELDGHGTIMEIQTSQPKKMLHESLRVVLGDTPPPQGEMTTC